MKTVIVKFVPVQYMFWQ